MRADAARSTLVAIGSWNQAIFLPPFVNEVVMPGVAEDPEDIVIGIRPAPGDMVLEYAGPAFSLSVQRDRLVFRPVGLDDDALGAIEKSATAVATTLPQTPMTSLSMNFGFTADPGEGNLAQMVHCGDEQFILAAGASVQTWRLRREVRLANETVADVSFSSATGSSTVALRLTFRREVHVARDLTSIGLPLCARRDEALQALADIYGLRLAD